LKLSEGVTGKRTECATSQLVNGLSFDVEDWFQTQNYESTIRRADWQHCEFRAIENTARILDILERHGARATFFVLGWVAERAPEIVEMILDRHHEVASHGFSHRRLRDLGPAGFRSDLLRSVDALAEAGAADVRGFRAPSFSITQTEAWAFDVLAECGFLYDSSVMPTGLHPDYGIRNAPLSPYKVREDLWEIPLTVLRVLGYGIPTGGGAYLRLFPYSLTRRMLKRVNEQGRGSIVYLHPWELDQEQPRAPVALWRRVRQTVNIGRIEARLESLLHDFEFGPIAELPVLDSDVTPPPSTSRFAGSFVAQADDR